MHCAASAPVPSMMPTPHVKRRSAPSPSMRLFSFGIEFLTTANKSLPSSPITLRRRAASMHFSNAERAAELSAQATKTLSLDLI